ncbi:MULTISPECIES: FecR family protein [Synechococcales]|uniref:FecR family protein n=1 Tax=Synechococcus sp. CS-1327 TaxID=2847977 RepID=UPI00223B071A|nr:FecR family protein [Synechococcus sp. CS-1327]
MFHCLARRNPERIGLLLILVASLHLVAPVSAATPAETATVKEILDGNELFIDARQARLNQQAVSPQEISTENSRGQLSFASGAAGRLNRYSQLRLGSGCFLLRKGEVLVSGRQSGCTRSSRLSVRGTNYVLRVDDEGGSELTVLEGSVEVEPLTEGGEPSGQPSTTVNGGERLRLSATGVVLTLLKLSSGDYSAILKGPLFLGFTAPLPAIGSLEGYLRSNLPGVSLPSLPGGSPLIPLLNLPRFF